ncbi:MAG: type IV secretion system DNA-binding domain-containing protein [Candidatus Portiera sp.]|nr:type IV secretion system DNA-binding domain-containing protein [Portiera sp.]
MSERGSFIEEYTFGMAVPTFVILVVQLLCVSIASLWLWDGWVFLGGVLVVGFNFYYSWHPVWLLLPVIFVAFGNVSSGGGFDGFLSAWFFGVSGVVQGFSLAAVIGCAHWGGPLFAKWSEIGDADDEVVQGKSTSSKSVKKTAAAKRVIGTVHLGTDMSSGDDVEVPFADLAQHTGIFGSTGTGKTTSILNFIAHAAANKIPLIYVDGKGDPDLPKALLKLNPGLQHFTMRADSSSWRYNPFGLGSATEVKDKIIDAFAWSEQYYKTTAERYLQLALKALLQGRNRGLDIDELDLARSKVITAARKNYKNQDEKQKVIEALQGIKDKDIASLLNQIASLAESEVRESLCEKKGRTISFTEIIEVGGMCLMSLETLAYPQLARALGKLIVSDIKTTLAHEKRGGKSRPVIIIFDEFGVFVGDNVLNVINMGRSAGANVILAAQGLADLETESEVLGRQIINNCNSFLVHRINTPAESEFIAGVIGTRDGFQVTRQVKGDEGSVRQVKEYLIHPDEIKSLRKGEAILIARANEQSIKRVQVKKVA